MRSRRNESSQRNEPPAKQDFLKRRTFEEGRAQVDAAHIATHRLYCDALGFCRRCVKRPCKRHRRCAGEPTGCLLRGLPSVPQAQRLKAQKEVIAGGPRRVAPATHIEWFVRRTELQTLVSWGSDENHPASALSPDLCWHSIRLRRVGVWPGFCFESRNGLESHATNRSTF
jgi:hypothetical protein